MAEGGRSCPPRPVSEGSTPSHTEHDVALRLQGAGLGCAHPDCTAQDPVLALVGTLSFSDWVWGAQAGREPGFLQPFPPTPGGNTRSRTPRKARSQCS